MKKAVLAAALALACAATTRAGIVITEVDPTGSSAVSGTGGTSNGYTADWFELTNTGASAVDITGWKMDDNSHAFANAVGLRGVTSIAAGQSVVFVEGLADGSTDATIQANFKTAWFGANVPANFTIGGYGGTSVGLSATADEVNIYDSLGNRVTGVGFPASTLGVSFDNSAGVGGTTDPLPLISTTSVAGTNGAFTAPTGEVGSPGVAATPEPGTLALLGLGSIGVLIRRRVAK